MAVIRLVTGTDPTLEAVITAAFIVSSFVGALCLAEFFLPERARAWLDRLLGGGE